MAERILIIGSPGSGKSTLAHALAEREGLPLYHLDQLYWSQGWQEVDNATWLARLDKALAGPRWIIEGNYSSTLERRLARADKVVLLDLPPFRCTWRVLRRIWEYRGKVRPDMAEGCPERFDLAFLWYTLSFRLRALPGVLDKLEKFDGEVAWLGTPREVAAFLASEKRFDEDDHG
ncbi:hypothetical protein [Sphingomonas soli]|uniref:hypothetical protein n=1 Tax=Sphingomonas soli TaxID=266127 RepID=UPI00082E8D56|nr:hypothetical protein [Sphingomonas soli]